MKPTYLLVEKISTSLFAGREVSPRLILHLEDGRRFYLENVSYDIFVSIKRNLEEEGLDEERGMITDVIESVPEFITALGRNLKHVLIDGFNPDKGFTARQWSLLTVSFQPRERWFPATLSTLQY